MDNILLKASVYEDYVEFLEEVCLVYTEEIIETKRFISYTEELLTEGFTDEEIFISVYTELSRIHTEELLNDLDEESLNDIINYLDEEYFEIFNDYYFKKDAISEEDFNECCISMLEVFEFDDIYDCELLLTMWIEKEIIKKEH